MRLDAGTHLGSYVIVSSIGAGGMGEVYRARDAKLGRDVAIKVLPDRVADHPEALSRFEHEAKALAALNHPNILAVYDFGRDGDITYVVLELLEGETLRDRLSRTSLDWHGALKIAAGIADGLAAAHERGIVHRDLKPDNIFLTRDGLAKILDFGLAGTTRKDARLQSPDDPTMTVESPGTVMGTAGYMSPEQVRGENGDARSDIFSFGCVLHEMISGNRAFARATAPETMTAILREPPPDVTQTITNLPPELARLVRRCLEKLPEDRVQTARDLAYMIRGILTDSGRTTFVPQRAPRGRFGWALGTAALLVVVAAVYFGRSTAPMAGPIDSLAVLPFVNESGDADADFLGEGIAESVINSMLTRASSARQTRTAKPQTSATSSPVLTRPWAR